MSGQAESKSKVDRRDFMKFAGAAGVAAAFTASDPAIAAETAGEANQPMHDRAPR